MANVSITFNGKKFLLSCEDGQEEHLEELLIQINQKFNELKNDLGSLGENKLLLITAVKVMDEYHETKKKVEQKQTELRDLSNKFRELKNLVYNYKDDKDDAVKVLKLNGNPFYAIGRDEDGTQAIDLGVYGVPETFIIDAKGNIRYKHIGPILEYDMKNTILPLINEIR